MYNLSGKTILLTGAAGHLGTAMSRAIVEAGAALWLAGRNEAALNAFAQELQAAGHTCFVTALDVCDDTSIANLADMLGESPLAGVVNNAYSGGSARFEEASRRDFLDAYNVTVAGAHELIRAVLPALRRGVAAWGQASVVNVSSMYGHISPNPDIYSEGLAVNPVFYGAAKAALLQYTRYAATVLGDEGVRVNSISPGPFPRKSVSDTYPSFAFALREKTALKRTGKPEDLQGALLFLLSEASQYITGADIAVDGGWLAKS